jgi:chromosome segregation ATPase
MNSVFLEPSSPIPENISESSPMLRQTETPMHNQLELTSNEIRENPYEVAIQQDGSHSTCEINTICDFILPNSEQCSTCDELASLKSVLEQKSLVLETRRKDVNSLKQELALAKEQISNLRAQLEENTRTLWSCLSMNGKSS